MKPFIVLESHNASYADPINVAKGEFLSLTGQEDVCGPMSNPTMLP